MRLFDKIVSQGPAHLREAMRNLSPDFPVFCVDVIAKHYNEHEQLLWGAEDYPYARPPWSMSFIEWHESEFIRTELGIEKGNPSAQIGAMVAFNDKKGCVEKTVAFLKETTGEVAEISPDVQHVCMLTHIAFGDGRVYELGVVTFWFLTEHGRIKQIAHMGHGLRKMNEAVGPAVARRHFDSLTHVSALAFTFANCANVKLEDSNDELAPSPKIRRRLKIPEVKRYTLNICGHTSRPSCDWNEGQKGVMPFHLCRGHFATYTADKPMFGNPKLVGRYWHPPHMKGKKENGEIIKDYAIAENA